MSRKRKPRIQKKTRSPRSVRKAPASTLASSREANRSSLVPSLSEAMAHNQAGRLAEAESLCRQILDETPGQGDALHLLGIVMMRTDRPAEAEAVLRRAVQALPNNAAAWTNLAGVLYYLGRTGEAEPLYRRAIDLQPNHEQAMVNLGVLLHQSGQHEEACDWFHKALEFGPQRLEGWLGLADAALAAGRVEDALHAAGEAVRLGGDQAQTHDALGRALGRSGSLDEAVSEFERAILLDSSHASSRYNLGSALMDLGRYDEARAAYRDAQKIQPGYEEARFGEALADFLLGRWSAGWIGHELRWSCRSSGIFWREFPQPIWDGRVNPQRLLAWSEQGVGDEMMFAGMVPHLLDRGIDCLLECDVRLQALLERSFPSVTVLPRSEPPHPETKAEDISHQIPIGSLPGLLQWGEATGPTSFAPYLRPDLEQSRAKRNAYLAGQRELLVGISWWSGNATRGAMRSLPLEQWEPILRTPGVRFVSLQYGQVEEDLAMVRDRLGVDIVHDPSVVATEDLDAFASQVAAMDLVISIDNSTVHLAGALGVTTWTMLPFVPDWRWGAEGGSTRWYPTMRLYRQETRNAWGPVIEDVAEQLRILTPMASHGEGCEEHARIQPVQDGQGICEIPSRQPAGPMPGILPADAGSALLLNFTANQYHWGGYGTSLALYDALLEKGYYPNYLSVADVAHMVPVPDGVADFDSPQFIRAFEESHSTYVRRVIESDMIVVNGEGTLHRDRPVVRNLLFLMHYAARYHHKPVHLVNHSCYPNGTEQPNEVTEAMYRLVYSELSSVVSRERRSSEEIRRLGVEPVQGFDSLPAYIARHAADLIDLPEQSGSMVLLSGGAGSAGIDFPAIGKAVWEVVGDEVPVGFLMGGKIRDAEPPEDADIFRVFQKHIPGLQPIRARTMRSWLSAIASARCLISGRFHHSIAAAYLGRPVVSFPGNIPKVEAACEMLGINTPVSWLGENFSGRCTREIRKAVEGGLPRITEQTREEILHLAGQNIRVLHDATPMKPNGNGS